jgi:hypothetical protein
MEFDFLGDYRAVDVTKDSRACCSRRMAPPDNRGTRGSTRHAADPKLRRSSRASSPTGTRESMRRLQKAMPQA